MQNLSLFVNPWSADDKYSFLHRDKLLQHFTLRLSQKQKLISVFFFFTFSKFRFKFEHFQKKRRPSQLMYFWTYRLRHAWLDKCLKSHLSEDPSTSEMTNGPKHCSRLDGSTFTIITGFCGGCSGLKSPVSENPAKRNIVKAWKHCWNLNDSTFTIFIEPHEDN